jgi:hypothetical protein
VLHLPDVAELVRDEVVGRAAPDRPPEQDRPPERVALVAAELRQPEEPRRDEDPHALDLHGTRVEVEAVEPRFRALERRPRLEAHARSGAGRAGSVEPTPV